ncbi:MAG TPA: hypothetical protein VK210_18275 [Terriglobia bacterium]|nr:hypothetical protein [Terriglobia bacterium]
MYLYYFYAVPFIFVYLLIRVWWLHSKPLALGFLGLGIFAAVVPSMLHLGVLVSPLSLVALAIVLYLIDRYRSAPPLR